MKTLNMKNNMEPNQEILFDGLCWK